MRKDSIDEVIISEARRDLRFYTSQVRPDFKFSGFHYKIFNSLQGVLAGTIKKLMVRLPPRHSKSTIISQIFPTFVLGQRKADVIEATYGSDLSFEHARKARDIITGEKYQKIFGKSLSQDSTATTRFHMNDGGSFFATSPGGALTGKTGDILIIDDPIKNREEARSLDHQNKLLDWYYSAFYTRRLPTSAIIILQTLWSLNDLSVRILEKEPDDWTVLNLPAISEAGEALWPEAFPLSDLEKTRSLIGENMWASLYQQNPIPESGAFFEQGMFEAGKVPEFKDLDYSFVTCDTSYNDKQENDFTVACAWGVSKAQLYLLNIFRERIKAADAEKLLSPFITQYQHYGFRGAYIEPKGHGIYLNQMLPRHGVMIPSQKSIEEFFKDRRLNKTERASNVVPHLAIRKVIINEGIRIRTEILNEMISFPKGAHDDIVDCFVDAIKLVYAKPITVFDVL